MSANKITKQLSVEEVEQNLKKSMTGFDKKFLLAKAGEDIRTQEGVKEYSPDSNYYKAMTLFEFDKGVLLLNSTPKLYQSFAIQFFKDIQAEYDCSTQSEKSLAEVVVLNFIRILDIQKKLAQNSEKVQTRYDIQYISILSKELDRAQRHYLTALQSLRMFKMPPLEVNIKTQTAIVGQNQVVQSRNEIN